MTDETDLSRALAHLATGDEADRLHFYATLADAELILLLEAEASDDRLSPRLFEVDGARVVAAFDTLERLAGFAGTATPYAALPGRVVAQLLAAEGLSLGLNLDGAAGGTVLSPEALGWLAERLDTPAPDAREAHIAAILPPGDVADLLLEALGARLEKSAGLAREALMARVEYAGGGTGQVLALIGAAPRAEPALARAVAEALAFSGQAEGDLDLVFLAEDAPLTGRLRRHARRFAIPPAPAPEPPSAAPQAPGTDPDRPPRLR